MIYSNLVAPLWTGGKARWELHEVSPLQHILQTIQVILAKNVGHCKRSKDELISDDLLWTPTLGYSTICQTAKPYIHQLCVDTGCYLEELPRSITHRNRYKKQPKDFVLSASLDDDIQ